MRGKDKSLLRTGFTTGACATAAAAAAFKGLHTKIKPTHIQIKLPIGEMPIFNVEDVTIGNDFCRASVRKDAGDDPDVTHQALIVVTLRRLSEGEGIVIKGGEGVGTVTKPGLPVAVGEPAVNPVPRNMICDTLTELSVSEGVPPDFEVEISVPGGSELALKTWNTRLGVIGGISILGTTGIVKPYSCAAWIASIHRGIDVANAVSAEHVVGSTGSQSELAAQSFYQLPDHAMLDMGDFVGGMLKYLRRHPITYLTIAGGFGKITKLSQGAMDLHSGRSQVDFDRLGQMASSVTNNQEIGSQVAGSNTAMQALELAGNSLAIAVANQALKIVELNLQNAPINVEVIIFNRKGSMVARVNRVQFPDGKEE